jgi:hypothetical protein
MRNVLPDSELSLVIHSPTVHVTALGKSDGEVLAHPEVFDNSLCTMRVILADI